MLYFAFCKKKEKKSTLINPQCFIQRKNTLERQKGKLLVRKGQEANSVHNRNSASNLSSHHK